MDDWLFLSWLYFLNAQIKISHLNTFIFISVLVYFNEALEEYFHQTFGRILFGIFGQTFTESQRL